MAKTPPQKRRPTRKRKPVVTSVTVFPTFWERIKFLFCRSMSVTIRHTGNIKTNKYEIDFN